MKVEYIETARILRQDKVNFHETYGRNSGSMHPQILIRKGQSIIRVDKEKEI